MTTIEFNLPTLLTLLRIAFIPLLVIIFYLPWEYANVARTVVFVMAGATDWLDGYLARKMKLETDFGAFLDPIADKLIVTFVLVLIVQEQENIILAIVSAIIIAREIVITALREWMSKIRQKAIIKVTELGKWKTTVQMTAIGFLLYREDLMGIPINTVGTILLYIAALLTLWSMAIYLSVVYRTLRKQQT